jgi:hypothetical protein
MDNAAIKSADLDNPLFVIVDPAVHLKMGHPLPQAAGLAAALRSGGHSCVLLVHRDLPQVRLLEDYDVRRVFSLSP